MQHTSNNSKGLPRLYTSFFLLLSSAKMLDISALHPISNRAVLPIVTAINLVGGMWPILAALIHMPN